MTDSKITPSPMSHSSYIGVDIGGTKTLILSVNDQGDTLGRTQYPTATGDPELLLRDLISGVRHHVQLSEKAGVRPEAIGVGCPASVDSSGNATSLSLGWSSPVPLKTVLEHALGLATSVENDTNLAALGEASFGAGASCSNFVFLSVGTGIGAGIVVNGALLHGGSRNAGEVGHMIVDSRGPLCACGRRGCLETLASGKAMERRARELLARPDMASAMGDVSITEGGLTAEVICEHARLGDAVAMQVVREAGAYLAAAILNIKSILDPDRLVLGGGVMASWDVVFPWVQQGLAAHGLAQGLPNVQPTVLGTEAGAMGAIALAKQIYTSIR